MNSYSHHELIRLTKSIIQPLSPFFHKGEAGKIAVIGGCLDYTGAPYFAAHAAATIGADLTHIICEKSASTVIKSYSPDLMVHPYLRTLEDFDHRLKLDHYQQAFANPSVAKFIDDELFPKVCSVISRVDVVVVGPGFGRDPLMLASLKTIIEGVKLLQKPLIIDADALYLISLEPTIIENYSKAIITPNHFEFKRICDYYKISIGSTNLVTTTLQLSKKMGVNIILKGMDDITVFGKEYLVNSTEGSLKRVGGQGDTLVGVIATLLNWSINYSNNVWSDADDLSPQEANILAVYSASVLVRLASKKAFAKYGRSMQTSNVHEYLYESYKELFEEE